jgi:amino acid permease
MIIVGLAVLILMASFVVSLIWVILQLLVVIVGIILVFGGIAALLFGRRFRRGGPWDRGSETTT